MSCVEVHLNKRSAWKGRITARVKREAELLGGGTSAVRWISAFEGSAGLLRTRSEKVWASVKGYPGVVRRGPDTFKDRILELRRLTGWSARRVVNIFLRDPGLSLLPAERLYANYCAALSILKVGRGQWAKAVARNPDLLREGRDGISRKVVAILTALGIEREDLGRRELAISQLVPISSVIIARRVAQGAAVLSIARKRFARSVLVAPELVFEDTKRVLERLSACAMILSLTVRAYFLMAAHSQAALTMVPERLSAQLDAMQSALRLDREAAVTLVRKEPLLLSIEADYWEDLVWRGAEAVGVVRETYVAVGLSHPRLFRVRWDDLAARVRLISLECRRTGRSLVSVLLSRPELFTQQSKAIRLE